MTVSVVTPGARPVSRIAFASAGSGVATRTSWLLISTSGQPVPARGEPDHPAERDEQSPRLLPTLTSGCLHGLAAGWPAVRPRPGAQRRRPTSEAASPPSSSRRTLVNRCILSPLLASGGGAAPPERTIDRSVRPRVTGRCSGDRPRPARRRG